MPTQLFQKQSLPTAKLTKVADKLGEEVLDGSKQFEQARHEYLLQAVNLSKIAAWTQGGKIRLEHAGEYFEELSHKDTWRWRTFLNGTRTPEIYDFDTPPDDALEAIAGAKALRCFDSIVFWYPSPGDIYQSYFSTYSESAKDYGRRALMKSDKATPMAVGVIKDHQGNNRYFPIARWGKDLQSIDEIEQAAHEVYRQHLLELRMPWLIIGGLVALLLTIGLAFTPLGAWALLVGIGVPTAAGTFFYSMVNV